MMMMIMIITDTIMYHEDGEIYDDDKGADAVVADGDNVDGCGHDVNDTCDHDLDNDNNSHDNAGINCKHNVNYIDNNRVSTHFIYPKNLRYMRIVLLAK